jgi:DNA (cytosine-5)-methyltransferase 1
MTKLLDGCCCEGGGSMGYFRSGFNITGIDIERKFKYPRIFEFVLRDIIETLKDEEFVSQFDVIHVSCPCQAYSITQRIMDYDHPDRIAEVRQLLIDSGKPYIMENVVGAPLINPIMLCGTMFGLRTYRHRLFEFGNGIKCEPPEHKAHTFPVAKMGRPVGAYEYMQVVGNFSGVDLARSIMGMDWASRRGLSEAIPPAYTEYIGNQIIHQL